MGESDPYGIYARVFNATTGENVTSEILVNNYTTSYENSPSICSLSKNSFAVSWHGEGENDLIGVYARVFNATNGENLTTQFLVNSFIPNSQSNPSICALSEEIMAVAWQSNGQDGPDDGIYARVFNATTGENLTLEF